MYRRHRENNLIEQSDDNRDTQFLIQKVAVDVQHGNAASVMATIPSSQDWAEFASLPIEHEDLFYYLK